ncbi:MAG: aldolase/citrate lyase family protein [bacterium]
MIKKFFFVPLINKKFIEKVKTLDIDYIVYDLEDAIGEDSFEEAFENLELIEDRKECFIRPRIEHNNLDTNIFYKFKNLGFNKFVIPKLKSYNEFINVNNKLSKIFNTYEIIVLVENPQILFDLKMILDNYSKVISGIGLGSHDYCNVLGAKHTYESYRFAHDYILNVAKSYSIKAIDIASMNIVNEEVFKKETKRSFDKGYRYKFLLHPRQTEYLKKITYFDKEEIEFAKKVAEKININEEFNAVKIDDQILEKPHIDRIKEILNYTGYGFR